jgi:hypothetical protein
MKSLETRQAEEEEGKESARTGKAHGTKGIGMHR